MVALHGQCVCPMVLTEITCAPTPGAFRTMSRTTTELVMSSLCSRWGLGIKWFKGGCFWAFSKAKNAEIGALGMKLRELALLKSWLLPCRPRAWSQRKPSNKSPKNGPWVSSLSSSTSFWVFFSPAYDWGWMSGWLRSQSYLTTWRASYLTTWRVSYSVYFPHLWSPFIFIIKSNILHCMLCVLHFSSSAQPCASMSRTERPWSLQPQLPHLPWQSLAETSSSTP